MAAVQSIWKMAFRNLSSQNTTTILTVAAIAVCVMTFVSIFSILDGLQLTVQETIRRFYQRKILVLTSVGSSLFRESSIPREIAGEYRKLPQSYAVSEEAIVEAVYEDVEVDLVGVSRQDLELVNPFQDLDGRRIEAPSECLVGATLARTVDIHRDTELSLMVEGMQVDLLVVGIFVTNATLETQILVDQDHLSSLIPRFSANTSIMRIKLFSSDDIEAIKEFTETNHPELEVKEARQVSKFFEKSIINISRLLSTIIIFVIILMVLGIYNSMNMVVSERTWEIGVIRAIGARRAFVLRLFVVESTMLALLGGLFGVALGIAMSHGITSFFAIFVPGSPTVAPLTKIATVGWGMTAALGIGLLGGIFPANRASRLLISEALSEG